MKPPLDLLSDLTPAQQEAVTHLEGPLLVLAGPGSGKTRVITRRIAYLLQHGVKPWNLLAITFTNKAASEMRRRVQQLLPDTRVWISTFHSLGARLLRQYADRLGLDKNFTIYDQGDRNQLVKEALALANIDDSKFTPERIQAAISRAKNDLKDPGEYAAAADDFFAQTVARVYPIYQRKLHEASALDFDDLLFWVAQMLRKNAEVRAELDARFRYVLVDEYQDTNRTQYVIARQLSIDQPNLCVVGDPDQSIYRWRGSDIKNILDFERDFPQAKVVTLAENYRSTKTILRAADSLISKNSKRKPKPLTTQNPLGEPVRVDTYPSGLDEAFGVALKIREAVDAGRRRWRDHAIFLRMNALSRVFETAMMKHRVPYQIVRGLAFFERKENKDILAYLRLIVNPRDDLSFLRAVNEPARGIGKTSIEYLKEFAAPRELTLLESAALVQKIPQIKGKAAKGLADFAKLMQDLRQFLDAPADVTISEALDRSGYRRMLKESRDSEDQERLANIEELITAAREFAAEDGTNTLMGFLEHVTLVSDQDGLNEAQDAVCIMTLHAAKGLEFPVVFMPAFEQGILPHERSAKEKEELEEERRLAFVGITRAMEEVHLSNAQLREFRGMSLYAIPSPFLDELPTEGVERSHGSGDGDRFGYGGRRYERDEYSQDDDGPAVTPPRLLSARVSVRSAPASEGRPDAERFVVNARVRHKDYGQGQIKEVSGYGAARKVKVRFPTGERTFILDKAPLELA